MPRAALRSRPIFGLHRERGPRPGERRSHRRPSHAGRQPAQARRAPRPGRLCRGVDPDLPAGRGGAARRPARRPSQSSAWRRRAASSRARTSPATTSVERLPIRGRYRGWEIIGPPPPAASGVHITQMLNILEGYDIASLGFGTVDTLHLLAEVLKIAFADRAEAEPATRPSSRCRSSASLPSPTPTSDAPASTWPRPGTGPARCRRWKGRTRRISPQPTAWATPSPPRRPSTAWSAPASSLPAPAWCPTLLSNFDPGPGACAVDHAGQERDDLDVADDGGA